MEIKQGDKVRVSKDAPKMYLRGWAQVFQIREAEVITIEDDNAVIETFELSLAIPTKYLVKVDAEAKEPKFKVGDKVKVNLPRSIRHNTIGTVVFAYASGNAVNVDFGDDNEPIYCDCGCLEPYTEPAEQAEAEKKPNHTIKIPVEVDLSDSYWDTYAADLAKELAIAYGKRGKSPLDAVAVAKDITRRLKQK